MILCDGNANGSAMQAEQIWSWHAVPVAAVLSMPRKSVLGRCIAGQPSISTTVSTSMTAQPVSRMSVVQKLCVWPVESSAPSRFQVTIKHFCFLLCSHDAFRKPAISKQRHMLQVGQAARVSHTVRQGVVWRGHGKASKQECMAGVA